KKHGEELLSLGITTSFLSSRATDRRLYLMRPDLGCLLDDNSKKSLADLGTCNESVLLIVSNGLSSTAMAAHLTPFLTLVIDELKKENLPLAHKQVFLIPNARVGLIDAVGETIKPEIGVIIIGERPGLSSPDSMAAYLTYRPRSGRTNAERNC